MRPAGVIFYVTLFGLAEVTALVLLLVGVGVRRFVARRGTPVSRPVRVLWAASTVGFAIVLVVLPVVLVLILANP